MSKARGNIRFEAEGKEWTLRYTTNALCELEDEVKLPTAKIVAQLQDAEASRIGLLRAVFWAGLIDAHPGIAQKDAGRLIDAISVARVGSLVGDAITAAFGEPETTARPQQGEAAGIGANSE